VRLIAGAECWTLEEEVMNGMALFQRILLFGGASFWLLAYAGTKNTLFAANMVFLLGLAIWLECWAINEKLSDKK